MVLINKISIQNNFNEQENILKSAKRGRKAKIKPLKRTSTALKIKQ
jgi:hypothetical protein